MTPDYSIQTCAMFGFLISIYIIYVEYQMKNPDYLPLCDSKEMGISCTSVFSSEAGHLLSYLKLVPSHSLLDLSNGVCGLMYYLFLIFLLQLQKVPLGVKVYSSFLLSLTSCIISIMLIHFMIMKLNEFCIVCSVIHLINFFIFVHATRWIYYYMAPKQTRYIPMKKELN
jgi:uncharacterized membrane protein